MSTAAKPNITATLAKLLRQPGFVVTIVVLAVAALGLNAAVVALQLHFKKLPVPPARALEELPSTLGPWVQVSKDEPLAHDFQDALGTERYVFRYYVDSRRVSKSQLAEFEGKTTQERGELLEKIQRRDPQAVINCAVTYYTGMADTVAHIPDRCYTADGYQPSQYETVEWDVKGAKTTDGKLPVRFINFEDQTMRGRVPRSVAYVFQVNGRYDSDPIGVRISLQDLRNRYGYYAKIELMTILSDRAASAQVMTDFLSSSLPEIEKSWPDWKKYESGQIAAVP